MLQVGHHKSHTDTGPCWHDHKTAKQRKPTKVVAYPDTLHERHRPFFTMDLQRHDLGDFPQEVKHLDIREDRTPEQTLRSSDVGRELLSQKLMETPRSFSTAKPATREIVRTLNIRPSKLETTKRARIAETCWGHVCRTRPNKVVVAEHATTKHGCVTHEHVAVQFSSTTVAHETFTMWFPFSPTQNGSTYTTSKHCVHQRITLSKSTLLRTGSNRQEVTLHTMLPTCLSRLSLCTSGEGEICCVLVRQLVSSKMEIQKCALLKPAGQTTGGKSCGII